MKNVLVPGAHPSAVHNVVCRSIIRDHPGCVSGEGGGMQRVPEAGAGSPGGRDIMPGPDEVPSQLHLLPRQAAGEVEVGVDECDSQRSAFGPSTTSDYETVVSNPFRNHVWMVDPRDVQ